ncbi:MAG: hypothetical protein RL213_1249 [Bacteroidota bacterium]|jgi:plastocyanin
MLMFLAATISGSAAVITVTNSGLTFSPNAITVNQGDTVQFQISSTHNVREVSQATFQANGSTALPGGFQLPFGGGQLFTAQLSTGMHYYVCSPHAGAGMKGTIEILSTSTLPEVTVFPTAIYPVPARDRIRVSFPDGVTGSPFHITDITGRTVYSGMIEGRENDVETLSWPKGIYLLRSANGVSRFLKD